MFEFIRVIKTMKKEQHIGLLDRVLDVCVYIYTLPGFSRFAGRFDQHIPSEDWCLPRLLGKQFESMFSCLLLVCLIAGYLEDAKASLPFNVSMSEFVVSPSGRVREGVRVRVCRANFNHQSCPD